MRSLLSAGSNGSTRTLLHAMQSAAAQPPVAAENPDVSAEALEQAALDTEALEIAAEMTARGE